MKAKISQRTYRKTSAKKIVGTLVLIGLAGIVMGIAIGLPIAFWVLNSPLLNGTVR